MSHTGRDGENREKESCCPAALNKAKTATASFRLTVQVIQGILESKEINNIRHAVGHMGRQFTVDLFTLDITK